MDTVFIRDIITATLNAIENMLHYDRLALSSSSEYDDICRHLSAILTILNNPRETKWAKILNARQDALGARKLTEGNVQ